MKRSILAACLMSVAAVPVIATADTAPYSSEVLNEPQILVIATDAEGWKQLKWGHADFPQWFNVGRVPRLAVS